MDKVKINKDKKSKKLMKQPFEFEKAYESGRGSNQTMDNRDIEDNHIQEQFIDSRVGGKSVDKVIIKKAEVEDLSYIYDIDEILYQYAYLMNPSRGNYATQQEIENAYFEHTINDLIKEYDPTLYYTEINPDDEDNIFDDKEASLKKKADDTDKRINITYLIGYFEEYVEKMKAIGKEIEDIIFTLQEEGKVFDQNVIANFIDQFKKTEGVETAYDILKEIKNKLETLL